MISELENCLHNCDPQEGCRKCERAVKKDSLKTVTIKRKDFRRLMDLAYVECENLDSFQETDTDQECNELVKFLERLEKEVTGGSHGS